MIYTYIQIYMIIWITWNYRRVVSEYMNKLTEYMSQVVWSICNENGVFGSTCKLYKLKEFCPGICFGSMWDT